jgi:hypothetical protein
VGHATHEPPQAVFSVASTHRPLHAFLPAGQDPSQGSSGPMHELVAGQIFVPAGQLTPHLMPSQVAVPPLIDGHGSHARPQFATTLLSTQAPEHW